MINVEGLSISFQGHPLFEDASFTIQEGERCGLVGRNGSGKTTLFRLLNGKETPDSGTISMRKNYRIGILDQHILFTEPTIIAEASLGLRREDQECIYKAKRILFGLGFQESDMERSPHELSGGYHLRLHLAKVLISEPDCLLLDEPTNYLDIVSIRWFTKFLQQWKGEFILISHDREFMDSVTTHTMGIHRQKIRKIKGSTIDLFEQILLQEEVHERTRQNLEKKRAHAQSFIDRFGAKATKAAQAQSRQKLLQRIPVLERLKGIYSLDFQFNEAPFPGKKMLEMKHASFSYSQEASSPLIDNLNIEIEKGDRIAIIGKNGRGKSTILRLMASDLQPAHGHVKCSENAKIGYFGQTNIDRLHPKNTVEQEIAVANPSLNQTEIKGICGLMMFSGNKAEKTTSVLSGGEKSRVLLGKIIASPCNLLLLDEPTHHLDMESIEALIDALEDFQGAVIIVTHSELILKRILLDKMIVCRQGEQEVFLGGYQDFLDKNGWQEESSDGARIKKKQGSQKEQKQQRAELLAARSKAVKPLDLEIERNEAQIQKLEKEQNDANQLLLKASVKGDSKTIQELAKFLAVNQKSLDDLYNKLEKLLISREQAYGDFTKRLEELA